MTTMAEMLRSTVLQHPDQVAVLHAGEAFTYSQFLDRVKRAAGLLEGMGLGPGDRFGIIAPNCLETAELFFAGYWTGAIPVPINFRLAPPEIRDVLEDSGATCVFVDDGFRAFLDEEALAPWRDTAVCLQAEKAVRSYEALLALAEPASMHCGEPDDDAILLYTGGTTGRSKGVRLTHRNILSDALQCAPTFGPRKDDVYLHAAPMFHSADLLGTIWFLFGATHVYMPAFSPAGLLETIARFRVTFTMVPPTMIIMALQVPDFKEYDLSSLRGLIYGASPMAVEWIRRTTEALPQAELYQGYGLTETSPLLAILSWQAHRDALESGDYGRLKSCGRPLAGVELRIVDDGGHPVPLGEGGEMVARALNVMKGYLNREEETRQALREGWFHTGDVGKIDQDGFLYLLDRKKDMVISGGENIYTSEVEAVLYKHAGVNEAAVIGVPDEKYGESLLAVIVPAPGIKFTSEEIIAHCRGLIGGYKIPRQIRFVEALPKSALGKVLKADLRETYQSLATTAAP